MKILGADFIDWFNNHFPDDYYWENANHWEGPVHITSNLFNNKGEWTIEPTVTYDVGNLGNVYYEGDDDDYDRRNLCDFLNEYLENKTKIPQDNYEQVVAILASYNIPFL